MNPNSPLVCCLKVFHETLLLVKIPGCCPEFDPAHRGRVGVPLWSSARSCWVRTTDIRVAAGLWLEFSCLNQMFSDTWFLLAPLQGKRNQTHPLTAPAEHPPSYSGQISRFSLRLAGFFPPDGRDAPECVRADPHWRPAGVQEEPALGSQPSCRPRTPLGSFNRSVGWRQFSSIFRYRARRYNAGSMLYVTAT